VEDGAVVWGWGGGGSGGAGATQAGQLISSVPDAAAAKENFNSPIFPPLVLYLSLLL